MKAVKETTLDAIEDLALDGVKQLRAFFAYQGENQVYMHKARLAASVISGYARLRASETNRMTVELIEKRQGLIGIGQPRRLKG